MNNFREKKRKLINGILLFCLFLCVLLAVYLILQRVYKLEEIKVEGLTYYTEEDFLNRILDKKMKKNTLLLRLDEKLHHRSEIPYIEDYEIISEGKNKIKVMVYEKILVGCVNVMGDYLYFDKDGLVTESSAEWKSQVPLIKGLVFDRILLHEKLKIEREELYLQILNLTKLLNEYSIPVRVITFNSRGEVELTTDHHLFQLGKREAYNLQIQKISDIFPSIKDRELSIDLSDYNGGSGDLIARPRNE